ncbi:SIR2 family protein [Chryseobacterium sp.]|uniref:SIR2 family protein n=1 Tax=Chryseobacterium sp. TaxID=1871047 RepID=UPI0012CC6085|nr:SIR2 family protein [Chryseobacterium sp.]MPS64235.1 hypothetical protein [Chryseobacterium sp.]
MKTDNQVSHLKLLQKEYSSENVSLLIGAGFSKNALKDFPSWNELLADMILELYKDRFVNSPSRIIKKNPHQTILNKKFKTQKIQEIVDEIGYLEVVSQFLKKKGMREAVEIYIEERTPYIDENRKAFIIPQKKVSIDIDDAALSLHEKLLEGKWDQIYTTNYDNLLEYTATVKSKGWQEITNGSDLSFSNNKKNIIKVHGSLRSTDDRYNNKKFEFDGCHDHCYIITKEDYENYAIQHEAFAQLMRISILKGVFCLLGFSGNDPNFLSWIRWVKDILIKAKDKESSSKIKVYVITIDDKEISKELELYYTNHHISIISLRNPLIKEKINAQNDNPKDLIKCFLEYIYEKNSKVENLYNKYWADISKSNSLENIEIDKEKLLSLSRELGFKKVIHYQNNYLSRIRFLKTELSLQQIEFALLAFFDVNFVIDDYFESRIKNNLNELSEEYVNLYNEIKNRTNTLENTATELFDISNEDIKFYDEALRSAFNLNFVELEKKVSQWNPKGKYLINKASLVSIFDVSLAKNMLLEYINNNETTDKNKYLAIQNLNMLLDWGEKSYPTVNYKNQNLDSLYDIIDGLTSEISRQRNDIKPYGTNALENGTSKKIKEAVRFLNFLLDIGPQRSSGIYVTFDINKWYNVFQQIYQYYPYPCFYFSLQYSSKDILTRIGQDFAYADNLNTDSEIILLKSLNNLIDKSIPPQFSTPTFWITSQLLAAVPALKWEKMFMKIWDKYLLPIFDEEVRSGEIFNFIKEGLPYLNDKENKKKIILDCIIYREKNFGNSLFFLYYLGIKKNKFDSKFKYTITHFISNISEPIEINIAGNIYSVLDEDHINTLVGKADDFLKHNKIMEDFTVYTIASFLNNGKKELTSLKRYIMNSDKLWGNGCMKNSMSSPHFLDLSKFENNISWSREDIVFIYEKLKLSSKELFSNKGFDRNDSFFKNRYVRLMDEMLNFLVKNNKILSFEVDYILTVNTIKKELESIRGFVVLDEGILADDPNVFLSALNLLNREIKENGIGNYDYQINYLISRFLNKRREGLAYCIEYLSYFFSTYFSKQKNSSAELERKIILGIDQYNKEVLMRLDLNVVKVSKYLISLSNIMNRKGYESVGINYWLDFKKSRRFNI